MAGHDDDPKSSLAFAEDGGFLRRWSRRKAKAQAADKIEGTETVALEPTERDDAQSIAAETDEPPAFDVQCLPDIDSLGPTSDFSVFMQAGVPSELKTKALRKLWRVKSDLANLDGLIDYGEDLTGSFKVVDHLKTAYEVGRGFLRDEPDKAALNDGVEKDGDDLPEGEELAAGESETDPSEIELAEDLSDTRKPAVNAGKAEKQKG